MKTTNQHYNNLCKAALIVLIGLLHFQACGNCVSSPNNHSGDKGNRNQGPQGIEGSQHPDPQPIAIGYVTLGEHNQYNHPVAKQKNTGRGACTCIVGKFLNEIKKNPQLFLYQHPDKDKIDAIVEEGIELYTTSFPQEAKTDFATIIEDVLQTLGLEQDSTTMVDEASIGLLQTKMLTSEAAIQQELNKFSNTKKLAVVRTGAEAWALVSYGNGTFDLFDPHGRTNLNKGNSAAFIKRTDSQGASNQIWNVSPSQNILPTDNEQAKLASAIYIFWLK